MIYAGLLGVMYFILSIMVIRLRTATKTGLGHDMDPASPLFRAVRIHGNFAEFVPFILLLMALDEMSGRSQIIIHLFGAALILARIAHYMGITKSHGKTTGRLIGGMGTFTIMVTLSTLLIIKGILL
jgi:uncharacterized protein